MPSNLLLGALVRLPKLVPGAGAIAAASPPCAHPLAGVLVQGALLRHPKSVAGAGDAAATGPPYLLPSDLLLGALMRLPKLAGAGADAATGPSYLRPFNLLLGALVRLPKLVPGAGAIAAACPPCARPLDGVLVQGAPLRHSKSVAGAEADAATGPPYLHPSCMTLEALMCLPKLVPGTGAIAPAKACSESWGHSCCLPFLCTPFVWRLGAGGGPTAPF